MVLVCQQSSVELVSITTQRHTAHTMLVWGLSGQRSLFCRLEKRAGQWGKCSRSQDRLFLWSTRAIQECSHTPAGIWDVLTTSFKFLLPEASPNYRKQPVLLLEPIGANNAGLSRPFPQLSNMSHGDSSTCSVHITGLFGDQVTWYQKQSFFISWAVWRGKVVYTGRFCKGTPSSSWLAGLPSWGFSCNPWFIWLTDAPAVGFYQEFP